MGQLGRREAGLLLPHATRKTCIGRALPPLACWRRGTPAPLQSLSSVSHLLVGLTAPALFLDGRRNTLTSAENLRYSLLARGSLYEKVVKRLRGARQFLAGASMKFTVPFGLGTEVTLPLPQPMADAPFDQVLEWFASELQAARVEGKPAPVFVIDEANKLMQMADDRGSGSEPGPRKGPNIPSSLDAFLTFCVEVQTGVRHACASFPQRYIFAPSSNSSNNNTIQVTKVENKFHVIQ